MAMAAPATADDAALLDALPIAAGDRSACATASCGSIAQPRFFELVGCDGDPALSLELFGVMPQPAAAPIVDC